MEDLKALTECAECTWDYIDRLRMALSASCKERDEARKELHEAKSELAAMRNELCYQKYLGMQIAMREVLEYFAKFELGDTALRQQETAANRNGLNEPLTLDELRQMDGEPVWVVYGEDEGMWALVEVCEESIFLTNNLGGRTEYAANVELEDDGITVYRRKLEEGTV